MHTYFPWWRLLFSILVYFFLNFIFFLFGHCQLHAITLVQHTIHILNKNPLLPFSDCHLLIGDNRFFEKMKKMHRKKIDSFLKKRIAMTRSHVFNGKKMVSQRASDDSQIRLLHVVVNHVIFDFSIRKFKEEQKKNSRNTPNKRLIFDTLW